MLQVNLATTISRKGYSKIAACIVVALSSVSNFGLAAELSTAPTAKDNSSNQHYSPYTNKNYPTKVLWGDQHIHTGWSVDAGGFGATLSPQDALDFAMGKEVISSTGVPAKLSRPLDWVVIADHSDMAGTIFSVRDGDPEFMKDPTVKKWHDLMKQGKGLEAASGIVLAQSTGKVPDIMKSDKTAMSWWRANTSIMEQYNDPGKFTAFIGYEWTSNGGGGDNLHRNVIYRDGKDLADQVIPMTTFDSTHPEDLWKWMDAYEKKTYGSLLAIPHNGNLSNGLMFKLETNRGKPLTKEWIEARAKWEPLYEIVQYKGYSEAHPYLSPNDEFASAELWDQSNLAGAPKQDGMIDYEYLREALKNGLALQEKFGTNPFKYGIVSGTDTHTALSASGEDNFIGKTAANEPSKGRWEELFLKTDQVKTYNWQLSAAGWTGVWAHENTRASIWDAMKRAETYGTTGPRMTVRFFGGFDFVEADAVSRTPAQIGYAKGVPMGADLDAAPQGKAPTFLVVAMKDPQSGNLDRAQIIKGWMDKDGELQEQIYNVSWGDADKRQMASDGSIPAVGNTVDVENATWANTIGDTELSAVWTDPNFNPKEKAFYYLRVLEIPTPRWTAYDQLRFDEKMSEEVPMTTQERAWTSPIWYNAN